MSCAASPQPGGDADLSRQIAEELAGLAPMLAARRERRQEIGARLAQASALPQSITAQDLAQIAGELGALVRSDLESLRRVLELEHLLETSGEPLLRN